MEVDEANEENPKAGKEPLTGPLTGEVLLGSITTNTVVKEEKGVQIRSSARVFKKMKLEQEHDKKNEDINSVDAGLTSPNADQHQSGLFPMENEGKGQPIRCSTRVVKKVIKQEHATIAESKPKKEEPKPDIKKELRKWNYRDRVMFFEAVNEFGKDFESIQQYINAKLKKKGASEDQLKTKDHVRTCFMRTFHDVSKHVKFSENIKKLVQELYGVINYGELYKKLGVITDKTFMKLSQLIYTGETIIRVKGKNNKIKTPMCRALVKLNQLDQKYEEVKLPNRVTIELRPKDIASYMRVQSLAQNPRLKTTLPIQKRLGSLLQCLSKRWKSVDAQNYEQAVVSTNPVTSDCVPAKQEVDEKMMLVKPPLRLSPPSDAKIELPAINISEYLTRQTICLTAYESRLGIDTFRELKTQIPKKKKSKLDIELKVEPGVDCKVAETSGSVVKCEQEKMEESEVNSYDDNEPDASLAEAIHDAVNTILALQTVDRPSSEASENEDLPSKPEIAKRDSPPKSEPKEVSEEDLEHIDNLKKGWKEATSENLMIGEIYLMYGSDGKLILEYGWDGDSKENANRQEKKVAANFLEMWNDSYEESWEMKQRNLTSALSKLLSLAKLHYRPNSAKCACGHVCNDKSMKNSTIGGPRPNKRNSSALDNNLRSSSMQVDNAAATTSSIVPNGNAHVSSNVFRPPTHILANSTFWYLFPQIEIKRPNCLDVPVPTMQQQLNSIQKLKPKFCNRKGRRPRQKQLVVERKLPLMPNNLSGHQIVRMSIISQEAAAIKAETLVDSAEIGGQEEITDPDEENSVISTVPPSPSRILKEGESEWINADVADYSLSSLLGHLESPVKGTSALGALNTNMASDLSNEMDAQLQSLMTENSMDFAASFADLAASVANDRKF
ncbi:hypothetical protein HUJ04_005395 [Dendroctonus ponderosae]|nr:hypothetical protein HUJ04_005395 [Dendroctonus ponderosae]